MKLIFDQDLMEAAYLAMGTRTDQEREEIYEIEDLQKRDLAFSAHVVRWFRSIGLEPKLQSIFNEWPLTVSTCDESVLKRVRNPADECAELFRNDTGRARIGVGIRSCRLNDGSFVPFLRHELHHIHDMLDPVFAYPGPSAVGASPDRPLLCERYSLLWDITIDARLSRRFPDAPEFLHATELHRATFHRAFSFLPATERDAIFQKLTGSDSPGHEILWDIASNPRHLDPDIGSRQPGATCPICDFRTFHWANEKSLADAATAIRTEFPEWSRDSGCCERCAEIYNAIATASLPATIFLPTQNQRNAWGHARLSCGKFRREICPCVPPALLCA